MNSISENNLSNNLALIKAEMSRYKLVARVYFFNQCINEKLKNILYKYNIETDKLSDFLLRQSGTRVLKAIAKIKKFDDRKVIYENMKGDEDE